MTENGVYRIRPSGRHILTIGRDLIQDNNAAVIELIKNAYDADASQVTVVFSGSQDGYTIIISDDGHGMSRDVVLNKWMIPSTNDKFERRKSPMGRVMQGRKGIGRYAASILGKDLLLETVTENGEKTTAYFEWQNFEEAKFLDDVEISVETETSNDKKGTKLTITGNRKQMKDWARDDFTKLRSELKKLISPVELSVAGKEDNSENFNIMLSVKGFDPENDFSCQVEPYPIFDLYDYRISGTVSANGSVSIVYYNQKIRNSADEKIRYKLETPTMCGKLAFDIRVYDRDKDSVEMLISRGLTDESGNYVGKLEARQLLNEFNGIGVYRNGFRIRPLGDPEFDWLRLNKRRVQNPSLRIGSNQVIGYVQIQSEEESDLQEKSARDGLRENYAFNRLKNITVEIINHLEKKRFICRRKMGLSKPAQKIEEGFGRLTSADKLKKNIEKLLAGSQVKKETVSGVINIINNDLQERVKIAENIVRIVAVYQGQATIGKIINVILHEGRHPLNVFRNEITNIKRLYKSYVVKKEESNMAMIVRSLDRIQSNADIFVKLFKRLDPLAAGKRDAKKPILLTKTIKDALSVFEKEFEADQVCINVDGPDDFNFLCWQQDIYIIITNLVDNSLYWMREKNIQNKKIDVRIMTSEDFLRFIDYRDNGPGIEPDLIASEVIFEPYFSTKEKGTGLGLAISGEAALRNELELRAFESKKGAWFRLQPKTEEQ